MATETTNYKLKKPAQEDFYDVEVFNNNADILDAAIAEAAASGGASEETVAKLDEIIAALKNVAISYAQIKCGAVTQTQEVTFAFKEIDTIVNDSIEDLTVEFFGESGGTVGTFVLKAGESINDVNLKGSKLKFSGTEVNARYILLG